MNIDKVKQDLIQQKSELQSRLERTHKHLFSKESPVSPNFHEQIKETENDEVVAALETEGLGELIQISRAIERIENGTYGNCSDCGGQIAEERLIAIPYADASIGCAESNS